jgi:polysaccharide export outer membrane protein
MSSVIAFDQAPNESIRRPRRLARAGRVALGIAVALTVGCATTKPSPPPATQAPGLPYKVGANDTLSIKVLPDPPIEREARVRPDGMISMDLIGDVQAAGRTPEEIRADIEQRMAEYRQAPNVTVAVDVVSSTAIAVTGEVGGPSLFPLERETRVSEAVAQAGGATQLAAASRVRLIRRSSAGETQLFLTNLAEIQRGNTESDVVLERGDLIYVPPAYTVVVGYNIRRIFYPFEVLLSGVGGALLGLVAAQ